MIITQRARDILGHQLREMRHALTAQGPMYLPCGNTYLDRVPDCIPMNEALCAIQQALDEGKGGE